MEIRFLKTRMNRGGQFENLLTFLKMPPPSPSLKMPLPLPKGKRVKGNTHNMYCCVLILLD